MAVDEARLAEAISKADVRILLMVLFHLTGDRKWLSIHPKRDVRLVADEDAGLPVEVQADIRAAALKRISMDNVDPAIVDPGDALMVDMMSICLGEAVPPEYALMFREELGFVSRDVGWTSPRRTEPNEHNVLIVGAGICGIALAARLNHLGIGYTIVERNADVGGVWLENLYPGCAVDTPSHAYSYSFGERFPWSRFFAPREEIHEYLSRCATAFGVRPQIRFNTRVTSATCITVDFFHRK